MQKPAERTSGRGSATGSCRRRSAMNIRITSPAANSPPRHQPARPDPHVQPAGDLTDDTGSRAPAGTSSDRSAARRARGSSCRYNGITNVRPRKRHRRQQAEHVALAEDAVVQEAEVEHRPLDACSSTHTISDRADRRRRSRSRDDGRRRPAAARAVAERVHDQRQRSAREHEAGEVEPCRRSAPGARAGTSSRTRSPTMPIGTLTRKIHRQLACVTSSPPRIGPSAGASIVGIMMNVLARARSAGGNARNSIATPTGVSIPPPTPWMTRNAIS